MRLFELFENQVLISARNLSALSEAARAGTSTRITVGGHSLVIGSRDARFVCKMYEQAIKNGREQEFLKSLAENVLVENTETLKHIISRFPKEVKDFQNGDELSTDLYHALHDYYMDHGEMPYGVSKARDGDPFEWVTMRFDEDLGGYGADRPMGEEVLPLELGLSEALDMRLLHGAQGAMKKNVKDPESERNIGKKYGYRSDKEKDDEDNYDEWGNEKPGKKKRVAAPAEPGEKRGRGRPRKHPVPDANAPKKTRGRPRKNPAPDPNAPKRGRGRPRKVREWIETLRYVAEGKGSLIKMRISEILTEATRDQIVKLQNYLNSKGARLAVDGIIGPQTRSAIQQFLKGDENFQQTNTGPAVDSSGFPMMVGAQQTQPTKLTKPAQQSTQQVQKSGEDKEITGVVKAGQGFTDVKTADGEIQRRQGARNWRNNNPGNIVKSQYATSKGAVGSDGRFAVFPTLDAGFDAKEDLLFSPDSKYINLSIRDAITRYAPPHENDTERYIQKVTQATGAKPETKMSQLNGSQRERFLHAVTQQEGFKVGTITTIGTGVA